MNNLEYATVFHDSQANASLGLGEYAEVMQRPDEWSRVFGRALLQHLINPEQPSSLDEDAINNYIGWYQDSVEGIISPLDKAANKLEASRARNRFNFHPLNTALVNMWRPVVEGGWKNESERIKTLRLSQEIVALNGLNQYLRKLALIRKLQEQGKNYFHPDFNIMRGTVEGCITEYDAAIVLLGAAQHIPGGYVVPAPAQFEHEAKDNNADFIFMNGSSAVGIQVKSSVTAQDKDWYSPARVVLIDGRVDMGNESAARINPLSSNKYRISWAGYVSASHVLTLPTSPKGGATVRYVSHGNLRSTMQYKMHAREILGETKSYNKRAIQIVEERIRESL